MSYIGVGPASSALVSTGTVNDFSVSPSMAGSLTAATGVTATTGNVAITSGNLTLPSTTSTVGQISFGGSTMLQAYPASSANIFIGNGSGNYTTTGVFNTGCGAGTLIAATSGEENTAVGTNALESVTIGNCNVGIGVATLQDLISGSNNVAIGGVNVLTTALGSIVTGSWNVGIGASSNAGAAAGSAYTGAESSNIVIGNIGVNGESGVIRIGDASQTTCYIAGISGATSAGAVPVVINASGQLGTIVSTKRLKDNIKDMGSTDVMKLRPVTFTFKHDQSKSKQHGLIAEEVQDVFPDLVTYDAENKPYSVKYHDLPAILLNELQRLAKRVEVLEKNIH